VDHDVRAFRGQWVMSHHENRLAGPAGAHEGGEVARIHVQVQSLEHVDLFAATLIRLVDPTHLDEAGTVTLAIDSDHEVSIPFQLCALAVAQFAEPRCHHLLPVGQTCDHLLLVAAHLTQAYRTPIHSPVVVYEHRRTVALHVQGRPRDSNPSAAICGMAHFFSEERHLHTHVGQDARVQPIERYPHLHRRLLPVSGRNHRPHLGGDVPIGIRV
jgi:hypothetical protein